ncbi:hypothetical protein LSTR_LSTR011186 [Laodelphax striatellus]|uniref:Autophagy-related protein 13 n=1 Tax=Laodelphax striatellus TaxID=195883 RepID=A0A482XT76_LAOST|nr:hypothetical protein LSTR_LSTR011186 [Laodelphax striatellus]
MSTMKLSSQEKKDLDKFMKFFTLKSAQIIVQSRLGEKVNTKCDPDSSGTVWFNLAIRDLPDVLAEAKKAMYNCSGGGGGGGCRLPVCVEISLRTVEGDTMILETWCIAVTADHQPHLPVSYAIYNRMGILLKSLLDDNTTSTLSDTIKFGAFADNTSSCLRLTTSKSDVANDATATTTTPDLIVPEVPFTTLLTPKTAPSPPPTAASSPPPPPPPTTEDQDSNGNAAAPAPDSAAASATDFIMVDLRTPFAGSNANTDLGVFYRECQAAPPLQGFQEEPTIAEQVGDLTKQLELFETSLQEYDNVITTLCKTDNNN